MIKEGGGDKDGRRLENIEYCATCRTRIFVNQEMTRTEEGPHHARCVFTKEELLDWREEGSG